MLHLQENGLLWRNFFCFFFLRSSDKRLRPLLLFPEDFFHYDAGPLLGINYAILDDLFPLDFLVLIFTNFNKLILDLFCLSGGYGKLSGPNRINVFSCMHGQRLVYLPMAKHLNAADDC